MSKWTILKREEQKDEVGNIYQKSGGVKPNACQKCKKKFDAKVIKKPIEQKIPFYKCKDCEYTTGDPTDAFDHKLESEHEIIRESKDKIIKWVNILDGSKANIKKIYDDDNELVDIEILCDRCHYS